MDVIGIDLSGPCNAADTAIAAFRVSGPALVLQERLVGADDAAIATLISRARPDVDLVVGLDAPLSYNDGGGDRPADRLLRGRAVAARLLPGSIMPPTLTRMAYLTLRGITVARIVATTTGARARIVEIHPGAACVLRGAPVGIVRALKSSAAARHELLRWLEGAGLEGIGGGPDPGDHFVAACAAALAAWKWSLGDPAWIHPADPPWHPHDMAC
ncbi:MAG: DUF429 domain-containing protein [Planctomycetia bacterium]